MKKKSISQSAFFSLRALIAAVIALTGASLGGFFATADQPTRASGSAKWPGTPTAPDGSTSEFSRAVLIQGCVPGIKGLCPDLRRVVDPSNNRRLAKNFDLPLGLKFEPLEAFRDQSRVTQHLNNFNSRSRVEWLRDRL